MSSASRSPRWAPAAAGSPDTTKSASEPEVALTLRDLLRGAIKSYIGNTEGGAGAVALQNAPTAMLFVRNPTGVSHSPAEHADLDDCEAGVEALAAVLRDFLDRDR